MMQTYCFMWNEFIGEVVKPISERQARERWQNEGRTFEVALGPLPRPPVSIVFNPSSRSILSYFFDSEGRRALVYGFRVREDERLFMDSVTSWVWSSPDKREFDEASTIDRYTYEVDGRARHTVTDVVTKTDHVVESTDVPLELNWEPMPEFGDWASLARRHRDRPADDSSNLIH